MTAASTLVVAATLIGLATTVTLLRRAIRRTTNPARSALAIGCTALALALMLQLPSAYSAINRRAGISLAWPTQHALLLLGVFFIQGFFVISLARDHNHARQQGNRLSILALITAAAMLALFSVAPHAAEFQHEPTSLGHAITPAAVWANIVFAAYLGISLTIKAILAARWARKARRLPWLATALAVMSAGLATGVGFAGHRLGYQSALLAGVTPPWAEAAVETLLMPAAFGLVLLGVLVAALAAPLRHDRITTWWTHYRALRTLHPLWKRCVTVMPDVALHQPNRWLSDWLPPIRPSYRLHRYLMEIWDSHRQLQALFPPTGAAQDRALEHANDIADRDHLPAELLAAAITAAFISIALDDWEAGTRPQRSNSHLGHDMLYLDNEINWWIKVAAAYTNSSVTATLTQKLGRRSSDRRPQQQADEDVEDGWDSSAII